jgi:glycosyltransferase involved in cell wall biosynthesis
MMLQKKLKNILILTPRFPPDVGGVAQAVWRHAQQLQQSGLRVEVWVLSPGELFISEKLKLRRPPTSGQAIHQLSELPPDWQTTIRPDLIHAYYLSTSARLAVELGDAWQIPVVLSARGNDLDRDLWHPVRRQNLLELLPKATALSGVTQALTRQLQVLVPHHPHVRWVPNSVASHLFGPHVRSVKIAQDLGIPTSGWRMGFVGELRQKKGLGVLLLAFQALALTYSDISLIFIGEVRSGPDSQFLKIFCLQNPHLAGRIIQVPNQPLSDLPALYAWLDALVFPSLQEGLANAALEALSCERPVVATHVGGFPDLITDRIDGRLIPPYQVEPLIEAVSELYLNPEIGLVWGQSGRQKMITQFTPQNELESWLALYQDALNLKAQNTEILD